MLQIISTIISTLGTLGAALINTIVPSFLKKDSEKSKTEVPNTTQKTVSIPRYKVVIIFLMLLGYFLIFDIICTFVFKWSLLNLPLWLKIVLALGCFRLPSYIKKANKK